MKERLLVEAYLLTIELRLYWTVAVLYMAATLVGIFYILSARTSLGKALTNMLWATIVLHTILIIFRAFEGMRPPFQTLYETLSWFAWTATMGYLFVQNRFKEVHLPGVIVAGISTGACLYALLTRNPQIKPLPPALQSPWYEWHVITAFAAYALFVVSFSLEVVNLFYGRGTSLRARVFGLPDREIQRYPHRLIMMAFPMLSFAIFSGAAWANEAWGRYWSWDPKETWSLITWTVYAMYLHSKAIADWRQRLAPILNILGFVCMVMTFLGVNWLTKLLKIPSLHTYAV